MSRDFHDLLLQKGIISHRSCPYTPQQNEVAERKNRHLLDVTRTLLLDSSVPSKFWVEALSTAIYLINRLPSQVLNFDSPYYRLYHEAPSYSDLHTFGCVCFVHLPSNERHKLSAQSVKCAFLGYSISHKGFVCYDLSCSKFRVSRNVVFFENQYFFPTATPAASSLHAPILPHFEDVSSFERFKPGIMYERRRPLLALPETNPPSDTASETASVPSPLQPTLRRSTRVSYPPIGLVSLLLYLILLFHHVTHRLSNMSVGKPSCRKNFVRFRIIIHGILFHVLYRLNPLGVNGYIP
jgi:transposase InsO family protein